MKGFIEQIEMAHHYARHGWPVATERKERETITGQGRPGKCRKQNANDIARTARYKEGVEEVFVVVKRGPVTAKDIAAELGISKSTIFNRLHDLLDQGRVRRALSPGGHDLLYSSINKTLDNNDVSTKIAGSH